MAGYSEWFERNYGKREFKAEVLQNGFVRVDCRSGLVRLWERTNDGSIQLRSGDGGPRVGEREYVSLIAGWSHLEWPVA